MNKLSCAITGHNPQRFKFKYNEQAQLCQSIKAALEGQVKDLYSIGVRLFYVGSAIGVDTWAAEIILDLKQQAEFAEIELFCAIPFPDHSVKFTDRQKERLQHILSNCTQQKIISRKYSPVAYKRLNYFMIDNSQYLIAVFDQDKSDRSSLVQMVNYAVKSKLEISIVHPDTAEVRKYEQ